MRQGSIALVPVVVVFFSMAAFLGVLYYALPVEKKVAVNTNAVICTDDAKTCPDGSAVGRTGPNCEFAECPLTNSNSNDQNTNTGTDLFSQIKAQVEQNPKLTLKINTEFDNYPKDIIEDQLQGLIEMPNGIGFAFTQGRNMFTPVAPYDQRLAWTGLLVRPTPSSPWQKYFQIPFADVNKPQYVAVGMFVNEQTLYLDVADSGGAGSGEGFLQRLSSTNGGQTWRKDRCYEFETGQYFEPDSFDPRSGEIQDLQMNQTTMKQSTNCFFKFASEVPTSSWMLYDDRPNGFSFLYPASSTVKSLSRQIDDDTREVAALTDVSKKHYNVSVNIRNKTFNPDDIRGFSGPATNAVKTTIIVQDAFEFIERYNEESLLHVQTPLYDGRTIDFVFSPNQGNVWYTNKAERQQFLKTIYFIFDPANGWKTYYNGKLGFTIKHPSDWVIDETSTVDKVWFNPSGTEMIDSVEVITTGQSVEEWANGKTDAAQRVSMEIAGEPGIRVDLTSFDLTEWAVKRGQKMYIIRSNRNIKYLDLVQTFNFFD